MKKVIFKIISFLEVPWVSLTCGFLGYFVIFVLFFDYSDFDSLSAFIGSLSIVFLNFIDYGFFSLIKKKRNSSPSGEDK